MSATEKPLEPGEQIVVAQVSDMTLDRRLGRSRLVATYQRVWVENDSQARATP